MDFNITILDIKDKIQYKGGENRVQENIEAIHPQTRVNQIVED